MSKNYPLSVRPTQDHEGHESLSPREQLLGMLVMMLVLLLTILLRSM